MGYKPTYRKGDWKSVCDRCGQIFKASQLKKTWDGLYVCRADFETRHPQDFLRGIKDDQSVPWTRTEPEDAETVFCNSRSAVSGVAKAGCARAGSDAAPPTVPSGTFNMSI